MGGLAMLKTHKAALESFGKKLEDKQKAWRSLDVLMAAKPPTWDNLRELSEELTANNQLVVVLSEGLLEATLRAAHSTLGPLAPHHPGASLRFVSSSLSTEVLATLCREIRGKRTSLLLVFQGEPSSRLLWCFEQMYSQLALGRRVEEVRRRVIIAAEKGWQEWAKKNKFRYLSLPERSSGRYLFFSEPVALTLMLAGIPAWQCVEGGRSLLRTFDKKAGLADSLLAYSALREVQLGESARESLLLPDETFLDFARWWRLLSEDSRQEFTEDQGESRLEVGAVLQERFPEKGRQWVTEILIDREREFENEKVSKENSLSWPGATRSWGEGEPRYLTTLETQRADETHAQPCVRLTLRRLDPMSIGALFAFFEGVVSASHKLADLDDDWDLLQARAATIPIESQV